MTSQQPEREGRMSRLFQRIDTIAHSRITAFLLGAAAFIPFNIKEQKTTEPKSLAHEHITVRYSQKELVDIYKTAPSETESYQKIVVGKAEVVHATTPEKNTVALLYDEKPVVEVGKHGESSTLAFGQDVVRINMDVNAQKADEQQPPQIKSAEPQRVVYGQVQNNQRTGEWEVKDEMGRLSQKMSYRKDKLYGPYIVYRENGSVYAEGLMKDDQQEGVWKTYWPDGTLYKEEIFHKGNLAARINYDMQGRVRRKSLFLQGKEDAYIAYDENGAETGRDGNAAFHMDRFLNSMKRQAEYRTRMTLATLQAVSVDPIVKTNVVYHPGFSSKLPTEALPPIPEEKELPWKVDQWPSPSSRAPSGEPSPSDHVVPAPWKVDSHWPSLSSRRPPNLDLERE